MLEVSPPGAGFTTLTLAVPGLHLNLKLRVGYEGRDSSFPVPSHQCVVRETEAIHSQGESLAARLDRHRYQGLIHKRHGVVPCKCDAAYKKEKNTGYAELSHELLHKTGRIAIRGLRSAFGG